MWALLTGLPSILSGLFTTINSVTAAISNEKIAQINATTDQERLEIGERISALQATQAVLVAEAAKSKLPIYMQLFMTLPIAVIMAKIYVWDKMLGWGSTDNLSPNEWYLVYLVFGFWFVHSTVGLFK
jgi:hypothetical protein